MHSDPHPLTPGVYERLMDQELAEALAAHPDLPPVLGKLDDEDSPESYSQFVLQVLRSALRGVPAEQRLGLVNRLLDLLAATDGLDYLQRRRLLASPEPVLLAVRPAGAAPPRRPLTPLSTSSLLTGVGVLPVESLRCYVHLVTFRKSERDFSPTTRYRDCPISPTRLHWESQSGTSRRSPVGQDYLHFHERGCTVLFFARLEKRIEGETAPFIFLGPASRLISADGDRPITMVWDLAHPMPAALFEEARPA